MRLAVRLLVPLTVVAFVACSGGGDAPVPIAQRFVSAEDAPGTKDDPVEKGDEAGDLDEFVASFSNQAFIDPNSEDMTTVFEEAGFVRAGLDVRFFGETHTGHEPHIFSSFFEFESEDGAVSALDWIEADSMKACPGSCAVRVSTFDVDDIADARGVHRIATAEDIEAAGNENEQPSDSYWVGFTVGSVVYTVDLSGDPGTVTEEQAQEIARALYDRLTAS